MHPVIYIYVQLFLYARFKQTGLGRIMIFTQYVVRTDGRPVRCFRPITKTNVVGFYSNLYTRLLMNYTPFCNLKGGVPKHHPQTDFFQTLQYYNISHDIRKSIFNFSLLDIQKAQSACN